MEKNRETDNDLEDLIKQFQNCAIPSASFFIDGLKASFSPPSEPLNFAMEMSLSETPNMAEILKEIIRPDTPPATFNAAIVDNAPSKGSLNVINLL